ncbi:MAG: extracellular solute-binding protein [Desulfopila sp.]|jgi:spermidine/putrescine transport system substrate-binding protein|nr:extracellular solute-binding protein [Desulfopila sp.]
MDNGDTVVNTVLPENKAMDRREFIKKSTVAGAALLATSSVGPWFIKDALSTSGTLKLFTWPDYSKPEVIEAFEKATGIKVKITNYSTNQECMNKLRAARATGFDIAQPSLTEFQLHMEHELYQEIDESRIPNLENLEKAFYEKSKVLGGVIRGKRVGLPYDWGTEAMAWNTTENDFAYGDLSFGTMWDDEYVGKVTCRPHSVFIGAGLYLEAMGKIDTNRMYDTYESEEKMRKAYDEILAFLIAKKKNIKMFWNNAQDHQLAFLQNGCVVGQTWDGPIMTMKKEGKPVSYMAPKEGAMTWVDSMAIVKNAENLEQAYAFINWAYTPEAGAVMAKATGYNSVVKGAADLLDAATRKNFQEAYPGDALEKLWWYVSEPAWFVPARTEYRDKFQAA